MLYYLVMNSVIVLQIFAAYLLIHSIRNEYYKAKSVKDEVIILLCRIVQMSVMLLISGILVAGIVVSMIFN